MEFQIVGLMSAETEKQLGAKLKFKNKTAELVDDTLIRIIDNRLLQPLSMKLNPDIKAEVIEALAAVIEEMPEIEI